MTYTHTAEAKRKIAAARLGKKASRETITRLKESHRGRTYKPYTEKGSEIYWKRQAKLRDDYTCQVCGLRDEEIIEVDHVLPQGRFPELLCSLENLTTLCPNCHSRKTIEDRRKWKLYRVYKKKQT